MRINHNISALNTYNKLTANTTATSKALEKLSSGLKINRAGDNAAGLAISEKMRGQIRGLDQASSNASDGISLIQTAEGGLNETHSILQRMRELAVQSSNDTNTDADRVEIQKEIDQLTKEIDRISTDTEFNTQKLLNGDKAIKTTADNFKAVNGTGKATILKEAVVEGNIENGTYKATVSVTAATGTQGTYERSKILTDQNGSVRNFTTTDSGGSPTKAGTFTGTVSNKTSAPSGSTADLSIEDTESINLADGFNLSAGTYSIVATGWDGTNVNYELRNTSDEVIASTGVIGNTETTVTFTSASGDSSEVDITAASGATGKVDFAVTKQFALAGADTQAAQNSGAPAGSAGIAITLADNAKKGDTFTLELSTATAPTATFTGADLAEGNYKLVVSDYNGTAKTATLTIQDQYGKTVKDNDGNAYQVKGALTTAEAKIAGISLAANSITGNSTSSFEITKASKTDVTLKDSVGNAATGISFEFNDTVEHGDTFNISVDADRSMKFHIGANEGQSTSLAINDMSAESLGISDKDGKVLVDLTSQASSDASITRIDKAISKVSSERAKLGAVQNRLEHTINNLQTSSENISSAESRIRDVDMAKEMMEFTKENILSQAAQSMLAQANQQPQGVLQLLR